MGISPSDFKNTTYCHFMSYNTGIFLRIKVTLTIIFCSLFFPHPPSQSISWQCGLYIGWFKDWANHCV